MIDVIPDAVVLSLYPNVNGLGYAVFESHLSPVDWGIKTARKRKHDTLMRHAAWLMRMFTPNVILLPVRATVMQGSRRLQKVATDIENLAAGHGAAVHWYSRTDMKAAFAQYGAQSKDAIAGVITRLLPEFEQHVPPLRKIWMSEDYRMGLFDAVALAMTFYRDRGTHDGKHPAKAAGLGRRAGRVGNGCDQAACFAACCSRAAFQFHGSNSPRRCAG
jgi:hypothetical protein